jgi:hypothetical protein
VRRYTKAPDAAFLSAGGTFVAHSQLVIPGDGFDRLPPSVRRLLSPALAAAAGTAWSILPATSSSTRFILVS